MRLFHTNVSRNIITLKIVPVEVVRPKVIVVGHKGEAAEGKKGFKIYNRVLTLKGCIVFFYISLILLSVVVVWFILKPVEPLQLETRGVPSPVAIVVRVVMA